jgi:hypothetical protein
LRQEDKKVEKLLEIWKYERALVARVGPKARG